VPVAEEVYNIYPESEWALGRLKEDPAHLLFKRFGESLPPSNWNEKGTKQGIYMMGPNGEYLEGLGAASGSADKMVRRLERALERWKKVAAEQGYDNQPVPAGTAVAPPEFEDAALTLRVSMRDLPREVGSQEGRRFSNRDMRRRPWMAFTEWAWNQNWLTLQDATAFVPRREASEPGDAAQPQAVDAKVVDMIYRRVLVDNVRGQTPTWEREHVKSATLTMSLLGENDGLQTIAYQGEAHMQSDTQRFEATLYGQGVWNLARGQFESFTLVAMGEREGAGTFNQRAGDPGPAPMGIVLDLFAPVKGVAVEASDEPQNEPSGGSPSGDSEGSR
jgi:hypothetical protein